MTTAVAIHPDAGDAWAMSWLNVVKPAYCGMHPVSACDTGLLLKAQEVAHCRLVAADLLRRDDRVGR
jgi:hypothetical protein